ncbi:HYC_CC_PP family protein [Ferruginibacter sp. SUN002]|uniref:HYC_CC_PP family protein n=1 Tax=Ferruginibacter sp. SUN002 TaxID=2937789 RepID=UPI003D35A258
MKKIIVAIIAFLYMGISSGIAMNVHYCMGEKAGVGFYGDEKDKCGKCGMKGKKGCCHDQHKFYKLNDSHKKATVETPTPKVVDTVAVVTTFYNRFFYKAADAANKPANPSPPPNYVKPQLYLTNSVFRL